MTEDTEQRKIHSYRSASLELLEIMPTDVAATTVKRLIPNVISAFAFPSWSEFANFRPGGIISYV